MQSDKDTRKHRQAYRMLQGLFLSYCFDDGCVRSALSYEAQPEDVFVVTYPKRGTTWLQYILCAIFNDRVPPVNSQDFWSKMPFLEACGHIGRTPRPIAIKTHLPFPKQPYSKQAKYLYLARNPYDCCVSCLYAIKVAPAYALEEGTFEEFLDMFLEGKVEFGDYFESLRS
ncbi:sulfotransferase 2B1-like [Ixodes scapularis]|uniref:sulfotransferase 2B1-like n=1 Tax=Ixodes scapularis TaxID=6945 RepID=UPI001A9FF24E|nr:sulfotransferase 2B1-like [Ixodes scapularis]